MILLAWNGVNSSRVVFLEDEQTTVISEGQNTFIWPCWGRLRGQNRTQFDSYYGRLAAVRFKTTTIWSGWDVQVWNFLSARAPYKCRAPPVLQWPSSRGSSSRDIQSSQRQRSTWSSLAHFRKRLNFSQFLFPKKISRRDIQQQVGFRKQCTNGLLSSLRIRHAACSGFGEILHTSISYKVWSWCFRAQRWEPVLLWPEPKRKECSPCPGAGLPAVLVRAPGLRPAPLPAVPLHTPASRQVC